MTLITRASEGFLRWFYKFRRSEYCIEINQETWLEMMNELGLRGLNGRRESGAFLLAQRGSEDRLVRRVLYYDDLDPTSLQGNILFQSAGYSTLWGICERDALQVIADVHTHPGNMVAQSTTDRDNPMIARSGHIAFIIPHYGTRPTSVEDVGAHEYHGDDGWISCFGVRTNRMLRVKAK